MYEIVDKTKYYPIPQREDCIKAELLPPGAYEFKVQRGMFSSNCYFEESPTRQGLIDIKSEPFMSIKRAITRFLLPRSQKIYEMLKMRHFLGVLLYGPPGTGKTCFMEILAQILISRYSMLVIKIPADPVTLNDLNFVVNSARNSVKQPLLLLVEEIDALVGRSASPALLTFLDGNETPENVIFIATTNHFDCLPINLTARHSRFGIVAKLDSLPDQGIEALLNSVVPNELKEEIPLIEMLEAMVKQPITIDEIKSVLLGVSTQGFDVKTAMGMVKERKEITKDEDE